MYSSRHSISAKAIGWMNHKTLISIKYVNQRVTYMPNNKYKSRRTISMSLTISMTANFSSLLTTWFLLLMHRRNVYEYYWTKERREGSHVCIDDDICLPMRVSNGKSENKVAMVKNSVAFCHSMAIEIKLHYRAKANDSLIHHLWIPLTHWGRDEMEAITQTTFSIAFFWKKMFELWLKFLWSLFLRVQLTIFQHWFR